jgi:hypothetical protein
VQLRDYQRFLTNLPFGKRLPNAIYIHQTVTIDLVSGCARHTDYAGNPNPPILHRREQFLPPDPDYWCYGFGIVVKDAGQQRAAFTQLLGERSDARWFGWLGRIQSAN